MDDDPFSDWGLRAVQLTDRADLDPYFASLALPLSDYTFSQLFTWRNSLRILWKQMHGHLCVFANGSGDLTLLLPPIGDTGSDRALAASVELMDAYNAAHGVPHRTRVEYASEELLARFDRDRLDVQPMGADYLYDVRRMIDLAGGDLASKRQAKNRFLRNYEHRVEEYSAAKHLADCRDLLDRWKTHQDVQHAMACDADTNALKRHKESLATDLCLESAEALGLKGLVVYVKEAGAWSLRGFTFGEALGRDQSSITIEKTDLTIKGLAQFIFSEFCARHWAGQPLVNVGDDWGLETLAWTKMSYRPVRMLQKFVLRKAGVASVALTPGPAVPVPNAIESTPAPAAPAETTVRPALKDDVAAAVELEQACFAGNTFSLTKRQLQYLQRRPSAVFLVAEQGGRVVGEGISLVRQHKKGLSGRVYSLAVSGTHRGQKIGQKLLSSMVDALAARGVARVYLEVEEGNGPAVALYERFGFRRIGSLPDYYGAGKAGLHMMYEVPAEARVGEKLVRT